MIISVIIPAYNEGDHIENVILEAKKYANEIIVINDGSTDDTSRIAKDAGAKVLSQNNSGYIKAIKRGFQEARGEIVVTLDGDGEFPADRIPDLVQPILDDKADMVQGQRNKIPRPSERFLTWLANIRAPVGDTGTGFRALRTHIAKGLEINGACICGIFSLEVYMSGGRIEEVPIKLFETSCQRNIAWHHIKQFFYLIQFMFR